MKRVAFLLLLALAGAQGFAQRIEYIKLFGSGQNVPPRNVEVWLPKEYTARPDRKFPVLYMHDGQNVFNPATSYTGVAWEADSTAEAMIGRGEIEPMIIVAVWNSPRRFAEYCPQRPLAEAPDSIRDQLMALRKDFQKELYSDAYLRFLVDELKPHIDSAYRTLADRRHTAIAGSSMGGLISIYALCEYPEVFGAAGCVSTHWPLGYSNDTPGVAETLKAYLTAHLPDASTGHRIYFDHGTATLDALYEAHQQRIDQIMRDKGYRAPDNWTTLRFEGAQHTESAWRDRLDGVFRFLYPQKQ